MPGSKRSLEPQDPQVQIETVVRRKLMQARLARRAAMARPKMARDTTSNLRPVGGEPATRPDQLVPRSTIQNTSLDVDGSVEVPITYKYIEVFRASGSAPPSRAERTSALPGFVFGVPQEAPTSAADTRQGRKEMANDSAPVTTDASME